MVLRAFPRAIDPEVASHDDSRLRTARAVTLGAISVASLLVHTSRERIVSTLRERVS